MKVTIPTNWNDVKLGVFQKYSQLNFDKLNDFTAKIETVKAFTGLSNVILMSIPLKQLDGIYKDIGVFLKDTKAKPLKKIIKIDEVEYGFHNYMDEMTLGEFADIDEYVKSGAWKNIAKIMSVLYRPITKKNGKRYTIKEYDGDLERVKLFENKMTMDIVLGATGFFLRLGGELMMNLNGYSKTSNTKTTQKTK